MEKILIVDFGSQYTRLIAKQVRSLKVYCEIINYKKISKDISTDNIKGLILSGGPHSVTEENYPDINFDLFKNINVLGICYGAQLIAKKFNGTIKKSSSREFGKTEVELLTKNSLFANVPNKFNVWMSHNDYVECIDNTNILIKTKDNNSQLIKAYHIKNNNTNYYGLQFHPEVTHTEYGYIIIDNFLNICKCEKKWNSQNVIKMIHNDLLVDLANADVVMAISGGVDSLVASYLIYNAIGSRLHCIFVNNGLLRKNEYETVMGYLKETGFNIKGVDASDIFMKKLNGVTDPEQKRKIIGGLFIDIFTHQADKIKTQNELFLGQGTIYSDVIESTQGFGRIKSHHNVGGLPDKMKLKLVEPLRLLFKDEVRLIGEELGIPAERIYRHPFPGPGLAIRNIGNITSDKVKILQEADYIYINILKEHDLYDKIWQAGAILLPVKSVGVMGDVRSYEYTIALRAVNSFDGMTASIYPIPFDILTKISNTIINNVKGVNRVVYDISSKPPATIEWE